MSRRSLGALEKWLRRLESRQHRDVGKNGVVDLPGWEAADRCAYDAAEGWEAQADVVEQVQGERSVRHAHNGLVLIEMRPAPECPDDR